MYPHGAPLPENNNELAKLLTKKENDLEKVKKELEKSKQEKEDLNKELKEIKEKLDLARAQIEYKKKSSVENELQGMAPCL